MIQTPATKVEVLATTKMAVEPGGDYDFPVVKNRRTASMQDITRVNSKETQSVDVVSFKELTEGWYGLTNQRQV